MSACPSRLVKHTQNRPSMLRSQDKQHFKFLAEKKWSIRNTLSSGQFWTVVLNFDYFRTGVLNLSFGKIFWKFFKKALGFENLENFQIIFGRPKTRKSERLGKLKGQKFLTNILP